MIHLIDTPRFNTGSVTITPGIRESLLESEISDALRRHSSGDWGLIDEADSIRNDLAVEKEGGTIFSRYQANVSDTLFYVITDANHLSTSVLLPSEY